MRTLRHNNFRTKQIKMLKCRWKNNYKQIRQKYINIYNKSDTHWMSVCVCVVWLVQTATAITTTTTTRRISLLLMVTPIKCCSKYVGQHHTFQLNVLRSSIRFHRKSCETYASDPGLILLFSVRMAYSDTCIFNKMRTNHRLCVCMNVFVCNMVRSSMQLSKIDNIS